MNTPTLQVLLGSFLPWHSGTGWMHTAREHVQDVLVSFVARFVALNRRQRKCIRDSAQQVLLPSLERPMQPAMQREFSNRLSTFNQSLHMFLSCVFDISNRWTGLDTNRDRTEPERNTSRFINLFSNRWESMRTTGTLVFQLFHNYEPNRIEWIEWIEKWLVTWEVARPGGTLATDVGNREAACSKGPSCPSG